MIVVPFIKSFVDEIQESQMKFFVDNRKCKELGIDISLFDSSEINTMKKIDTYSVYYSDNKVATALCLLAEEKRVEILVHLKELGY